MQLNDFKLEYYWDQIPTTKEAAATYPELKAAWNMTERSVRAVLHELSRFDNGDNYVLIRSSRNKGFYKTDDPETLAAFKKECLNKGRSVFVPVRKINRVLAANGVQFSLENNMRLYRERAELTQAAVCDRLRTYETAIDNALLSKMENGVCLPTPYQLVMLAQLYGCDPGELVRTDLF